MKESVLMLASVNTTFIKFFLIEEIPKSLIYYCFNFLSKISLYSYAFFCKWFMNSMIYFLLLV